MKKLLMAVLALGMALALCSCALLGVRIDGPQASADVKTVEPEETQTAQPSEEPAAQPDETEPVQWAENLSGNLAAGGHMAMDAQGALYAARNDGIYKQDGQGLRRICEDNASDLNVCGDRLIYVSSDWTSDSGKQRIVSVDLEGGDRKTLTEDAPVEAAVRYSDDMTEISATYYEGYTDVAVWDGYIYYVAGNGNGDTQQMYNPYEDKNVTVTWYSEKSIYRMPVEGGEAQELAANLGNGRVHLAVAEGRLWYATCYDSAAYSYPTVTFHSCAPDGSDDRLLYGNGSLTDENATHELVKGLFAADGLLYVHAYDSEGDFPNGRLMRVKDGEYEMLGEETYHVPTNVDDQGRLYWFVHDGDVLWDQDDEGVVVAEYLHSPRLIRTQGGADMEGCEELLTFSRLDRFGSDFSMFEVYALGGKAYALTNEDVYLLENGAATEVMDLPELDEDGVFD